MPDRTLPAARVVTAVAIVSVVVVSGALPVGLAAAAPARDPVGTAPGVQEDELGDGDPAEAALALAENRTNGTSIGLALALHNGVPVYEVTVLLPEGSLARVVVTVVDVEVVGVETGVDAALTDGEGGGILEQLFGDGDDGVNLTEVGLRSALEAVEVAGDAMIRAVAAGTPTLGPTNDTDAPGDAGNETDAADDAGETTRASVYVVGDRTALPGPANVTDLAVTEVRLRRIDGVLAYEVTLRSPQGDAVTVLVDATPGPTLSIRGGEGD